jgi:PAS domain S-box-containing protein
MTKLYQILVPCGRLMQRSPDVKIDLTVALDEIWNCLPDMALNQDIPTGRIALMDLIDPGGALHAYPGPILLLDRQNRIAAANPAGAGLSHNILTGEAASTLAMVEAARDGAPCTDKVIDAATGEITDLVALPAGDGEHVLLCGRDISLDQNLRDALVDSRQRCKDLVEVSSDFAWETDEAGKFAFVSPAGVLGLMPDQLIGRAATDFIPRIEGLDVISPFDTCQRLEEVEFQFTSADGSHATLGGAATPLFDPEGNWRGARGVCRDITEDRTRQEALGRIRDRERLLNFITRAIRNEVEPHAMLDAAATVIRRASSADGCMVVRRDAMADNKPVRGALSGDASDIINPELIDVTDDGDGKPTVEERDGLRLLSVAASYHRAVNGGLVLWRASDGPAWSEHEIDQITRVAPQIAIALQQVAAHLDLERLSSTDMLTGLYNRRSFVDLLTGRIEGEATCRANPARWLTWIWTISNRSMTSWAIRPAMTRWFGSRPC